MPFRSIPPAARTLAALAVLLVFARGPAAPAQDGGEPLRAGVAAVDVTPREYPVNMPGGFNDNLAQSAHDPLHSRALVLEQGRTRVALVLVDSVGVAQPTMDEAKALASQRTGIPTERMLVSATHSHSAAPSNVTEGRATEVAYRKLLVEGMAESIVRAAGAVRPAAVGAGVHPLPDEVFNRRWFLKPGAMPVNPFGGRDLVKMNPGTNGDILLHPAGPTDPDVSILSVQDAATRRPLALYANYSLHYVGGTPRAQISADYFGEFSRLMPGRLGAGPEFVAMLTNGTSGDINNIPFRVGRAPREPFEQIRQVAGKTADAAWHARSRIAQHEPAARLDMVQRSITLHHRRPSPEQVEWAKRVLATTDEKKKAELPPLAEAYARRALTLAAAPESLTILVQAIRIGDLAICTSPFETFAETGLDLKRRSPFPRTMVVELANGSHGYLPTPEQHRLGGYETWLGTNRVQEDASEILTRNLLEMLKELAARK